MAMQGLHDHDAGNTRVAREPTTEEEQFCAVPLTNPRESMFAIVQWHRGY